MNYNKRLNVFESHVYRNVLRLWKARSKGPIDFRTEQGRGLVKDLNLLPTDYIILESIYNQMKDGKLFEKGV